MILTSEEARDVVYNESNEWVEIYQKVYDTTRWPILKEGVFKYKPDGKHFQFDWSVGSTESQDEEAFEFENAVTPIEVEEIDVVTTKWIAVKN